MRTKLSRGLSHCKRSPRGALRGSGDFAAKLRVVGPSRGSSRLIIPSPGRPYLNLRVPTLLIKQGLKLPRRAEAVPCREGPLRLKEAPICLVAGRTKHWGVDPGSVQYKRRRCDTPSFPFPARAACLELHTPTKKHSLQCLFNFSCRLLAPGAGGLGDHAPEAGPEPVIPRLYISFLVDAHFDCRTADRARPRTIPGLPKTGKHGDPV